MGDVVPEWGARRVLAHAANGASVREIAGMLGTSDTTVERVIKASRNSGGARVPRQGQGKVDDVRWIFAGPNGPETWRHLNGATPLATATN